MWYVSNNIHVLFLKVQGHKWWPCWSWSWTEAIRGIQTFVLKFLWVFIVLWHISLNCIIIEDFIGIWNQSWLFYSAWNSTARMSVQCCAMLDLEAVWSQPGSFQRPLHDAHEVYGSSCLYIMTNESHGMKIQIPGNFFNYLLLLWNSVTVRLQRVSDF